MLLIFHGKRLRAVYEIFIDKFLHSFRQTATRFLRNHFFGGLEGWRQAKTKRTLEIRSRWCKEYKLKQTKNNYRLVN